MKLSVLAALLVLLTASPPVFGTSSLPGAPVSPPPTATITGRVLLPDRHPVTGIVLLYDQASGPAPSPRNYWRVPDLISFTESDGRFALTVPAGTYYLMAAQKNPDNEVGPPQGKEHIYLHGDANWNPLPITVSAGSRVDLGTRTASLWTPEMVRRSGEITAVSGIVVDQEGKPVAKAAVFGYLSPGATGRPTFVSDRTGADGKYLLRVADGGTYFLKVRSVFGGGTPQQGEFLNVTEEFEPTSVTVIKGRITGGVTLKVKKFSRAGSGDKRLQAPAFVPAPSSP